MLKLEDGRDKLYQWDLNRKVLVDGEVNEVHFTNINTEEVYKVKVVDGKALIPNILLQSSYDIICYAFDVDYTKYDTTFEVVSRRRPAEYVYTKPEDEKIWITKLDKGGWAPNKVMVTNSEGDIVEGTVEFSGGGAVDSVNGKKGIVVLKANDIAFDDGETFQQKLDSGVLRGQDGIIGRDGAPGRDGKDGLPGKDGKDGAIGPQGPQGLTGPKGDTGAPGIQGPQGLQGIPGKDGKDGILSFKDLTVEEKASLKGEKGDIGPQGIPGKDGAKGADGKDGLPGKDGKDGAKGEQGIPGPQGPAGKNGLDGAPGAKGDKGADGLPGANGKDGKDGLPGAPGRDGVDGKTPVKGVDYFTVEDKAELVNQVLTTLPKWTGGAY